LQVTTSTSAPATYAYGALPGYMLLRGDPSTITFTYTYLPG